MLYRRYRSDKQVVTGTADNQVKLRKVPPDHVLEVTHFACADRSTANKTMELGYIDAAGVNRILIALDGSQNYHVFLSGESWIEEGETPYGKVYSPTNSDVFIASCHGRLWPKDCVGVIIAKVQREDNVPD